MKYTLGLDLGTNSIGWALVGIDEENNPAKIINMGSRIIPMSQDIIDKFGQGVTESSTAERTSYRGVRRLRERSLLRRERLHRVLHILKFLPEHYDKSIGWDKADYKTFGKFKGNSEPKLAWKPSNNKHQFIFHTSYLEMIEEFKKNHQLNSSTAIPMDWTIFYLRKKALSQAITKEELAWIILQFNQKRGYYQLRGEDEEIASNKTIEYHPLKVVKVEKDETSKKPRYIITFENGWKHTYDSKTPIDNWLGQTKEFIVTTEFDDDGHVKTDKEGDEKRSFRIPKEDDWTLVKKKTEQDVERSNKTVGAYIFDHLLLDPQQKIKGGLVRTIERKFYKQELIAILEAQQKFHKELTDSILFNACANELYPNNHAHRENLINKGSLLTLFIQDILFYHRPLKSKKSLIDNCPFERRHFKKDGQTVIAPVKCIAKSNPLFQEIRLWQFIDNLKIIQREKMVGSTLTINQDVTTEFLTDAAKYTELFDWLTTQEKVTQKSLFKQFFKLKEDKVSKEFAYKWNYVEDREYPCYETRSALAKALKVTKDEEFLLNPDFEYQLWHLLYSVEDKIELTGAVLKFVEKNKLSQEAAENIFKIKPFKKDYGSYSEKAIKKLLPFMRIGKYWSEDSFDIKSLERINRIIDGEVDNSIEVRAREKLNNLRTINQFQGLSLWLASYAVYNRHSEVGEIIKWNTPEELNCFLIHEFKQHSMRNPIVEQIVLETLRTVKDIWSKYGKPSRIHVEMGRDLKNPAKTRSKISSTQSDNERTRMRIFKMLTLLKAEVNYTHINPYSSQMQDKLRLIEEGVMNQTDAMPDNIKDLFNTIAKENEPSRKELEKYMLWLDQNYLSPYTGKPIALSDLFTPKYEIEHVIPKKRFYDDSFSNKIICESEVNKLKDAQLAMEFIEKEGGQSVQIGSSYVKILTRDEYQNLVSSNYRKSFAKMNKLLATDVPSGFNERQLNDSRYISRTIVALLSNIVRDDNEAESTSKYILPTNGKITTVLKNDWGLNDIWSKLIQPRFERLNEMTATDDYGVHVKDQRGQRFQIRVPFDLQANFNKKRIDHRHHAMDALVIACATRAHVQYINNVNRTEQGDKNDKIHTNLQKKLCDAKNGNSYWFKKPWDSFTTDAYEAMQEIIVTHKQNLRVLNSTKNKTQHYNSDGVKALQPQTKGDHFAIRKPLHQETIYGQVTLRETKSVQLKLALNDWKSIVDKQLKNHIKGLIAQYGKFDAKTIHNYFKDRQFKLEGVDVKKVDVYLFNANMVATRKSIDESITLKQIEKITDSGIKKIMMNHLIKNENDLKAAFGVEGLAEMNKNIVALNDGKPHNPIYKVRMAEDLGNKFTLGTKANNATKYAVAAKGTNLYFGIYLNEKGERTFYSIPLEDTIGRLKQKQNPVPEINELGEKLVFQLSPNDLVYIPSSLEIENPTLFNPKDLTSVQISRIYKMVSCSGIECHFLPTTLAKVILKGKEFTSVNKSEKTIDNINIKRTCWKLKLNRLGEITDVIK